MEIIEIIIIFTGISTIIASVVLILSFYANKKETRLRQRPWLGLYRDVNRTSAIFIENNQIILPFKNFGPVPARNVKYEITELYTTPQTLKTVEFSIQNKRVLDIGPNEILNCYLDVEKYDLKKDKNTHELKLDQEYYFAIHITFEDLEKKERLHSILLHYKNRFVGIESKIT